MIQWPLSLITVSSCIAQDSPYGGRREFVQIYGLWGHGLALAWRIKVLEYTRQGEREVWEL